MKAVFKRKRFATVPHAVKQYFNERITFTDNYGQLHGEYREDISKYKKQIEDSKVISIYKITDYYYNFYPTDTVYSKGYTDIHLDDEIVNIEFDGTPYKNGDLVYVAKNNSFYRILKTFRDDSGNWIYNVEYDNEYHQTDKYTDDELSLIETETNRLQLDLIEKLKLTESIMNNCSKILSDILNVKNNNEELENTYIKNSFIQNVKVF